MPKTSLRVLCLSEHFPPRVGGTSRYAHEICAGLADLGHEVRVIVPTLDEARTRDRAGAFRVVQEGPVLPAHGDPTRSDRYAFCRAAAQRTLEAVRRGEVDVVHVLFGLFLMETLNTQAIAEAGAATVATVHNVPPMECSGAWPGQSWPAQMKDAVRLRAVAVKNAVRLRRHRYTAYVTPSEQVSGMLARILPSAAIDAIGHGVSLDLMERMSPPPTRRPAAGETVRLLTVAGWAPHKRQHLIPDVADRLRARGLAFAWDVVGPNTRVAGYFEAVSDELRRRDLTDHVRARGALDQASLAALYDTAHLYVQPSTEEGFCMAALDAAAAGLPVIGSPAGALPDLCAASGGRLTDSEPAVLADAIAQFRERDLWPGDAGAQTMAVRQRYSWTQSATAVSDLYRRSIGREARSGSSAGEAAPRPTGKQNALNP